MNTHYILRRTSDGRIHCPNVNNEHCWRIDGKGAWLYTKASLDRTLERYKRLYHNEVFEAIQK